MYRGVLLLVPLSWLLVVAVLRAQTAPAAIPYADARPILDALKADLLPPELGSAAPAAREALWPGWVARRDAAIRSRLAQADEDSLLNLLLLGTAFTPRPRVTDLAALRTREAALERLDGRLDDLTAALAAPGDERLQFARDVVVGRGLDPAFPGAQPRIREYLLGIVERVTRETEAFARTAAAMSRLDDPAAKLALSATNYRDRGLSSDTSIVPSFAVDQALEDLEATGRLRRRSIRRVALIGPGLDVIDRRDGYDFYPVQTVQPFALLDSLARLGLAAPDGLQLTAFDVSPRVNGHLEAARQRARAGRGYLLHVALGGGEAWSAALTAYWARVGTSVGGVAAAAAPPPGSGVRVRAVQVRPDVVLSVVPSDLNIILQRLDPAASTARFDLVVATNVFIYYDVFEQSLALANVARMLRPGGLLLSNTQLTELPGVPMTRVAHTDVVYTETAVGDRVMAYERGGSR